CHAAAAGLRALPHGPGHQPRAVRLRRRDHGLGRHLPGGPGLDCADERRRAAQCARLQGFTHPSNL
ncbi:MAG: hypothetical protein M1823_009110, partial [Watsoniomyces obsoletus]